MRVRYRPEIGLQRIRFNVHIEQELRSKKNSLPRLLSVTETLLKRLYLAEEVQHLFRGDGRVEVRHVHGSPDLLDPLRLNVPGQRRVLRETHLRQLGVDGRDHLIGSRSSHLKSYTIHYFLNI